jgi:hypothetical protein
MVTKVSLGGLALIVIGLIVVIVHALNLYHVYSIEFMLPEFGLILIGISIQLLGLGVIQSGKK